MPPIGLKNSPLGDIGAGWFAPHPNLSDALLPQDFIQG
jgi:hypothetical protein